MEGVPAEVLQDVNCVVRDLNNLEEQFRLVLDNCTIDSIKALTPLERASTFLNLSKTVNALFCAFLRTQGESPEDHPAHSELSRVDLYEEKVEHAQAKNKAPTRPSTSLNIHAANRFIEHAIPDLTEEQKQQVRDLGKTKQRVSSADVTKTKNQMPKMPKMQMNSSVAQAAAAFLAEATKELMTQKPN